MAALALAIRKSLAAFLGEDHMTQSMARESEEHNKKVAGTRASEPDCQFVSHPRAIVHFRHRPVVICFRSLHSEHLLNFFRPLESALACSGTSESCLILYTSALRTRQILSCRL